MTPSDTTDLACFLSAHAPVFAKPTFADGAHIGSWRVIAFLGRGGSGEVYRVENDASRQVAALKIHIVRDGAAEDARAVDARHFMREAAFLAENRFPFFPEFFDVGEWENHAFFVMELLETRAFPSRDRAVASFLTKVCLAVRTLHRRGLVHRDIKPSNILFRGNEPVLIDLGLLKETTRLGGNRDRAGAAVTIVGGHAVGAGTPGFAAPEQFGGGEISPATDIHALGILIDECFAGRPPRAWNRIVRRATSTLPKYRYQDVEEMIQAISWRHLSSACAWVGGVAAVASFAALAFFVSQKDAIDPVAVRKAIIAAERGDENQLWQSLCRYVVTNENQQVVTVDLKGRCLTFKYPVPIYPGPVWHIIGPGVLDATLERRILPERGVVSVMLENCLLVNRTSKPPEEAALKYAFRALGHLNFPNQQEQADENRRELNEGGFLNGFDGASNSLYFDPRVVTIPALASRRNADFYSTREN